MSAGRGARSPGLDILRGAAILLVMMRHAWPGVFGTAGIVGVLLFFVLSGHLITGLLVMELQREGRVNLMRFYLHRALRLLPAMFFMLSITVAVSLVFRPLADDTSEVVWGAVRGATYTSNIPGLPGSPVFGHLWTLSTEEQFYLVWPVVLLVSLARGWMRLVGALVITGIMGLLVIAILVFPGQAASLYSSPIGWTIGIVVGSLAFFARDHLRSLLTDSTWRRRSLPALSGLVLAAACFLPENKSNPWGYLVLGPVISVFSLVLILRMQPGARRPGAWASPFLFLGRISYAAYLWNFPIALWCIEAAGGVSPVSGMVSIALTVGVAAISWYLVEKPALGFRRRLDRRWEPVPRSPR